MMGSSHFLPLPFPTTHRLAHQQNSENMVTEKNKIEEENFLQMSCYSHGWQKVSRDQIPDDGYLRTDTDGYRDSAPATKTAMAPQTENGGADGILLCQKDKRRFSKTSGTSSRTRADDLSV